MGLNGGVHKVRKKCESPSFSHPQYDFFLSKRRPVVLTALDLVKHELFFFFFFFFFFFLLFSPFSPFSPFSLFSNTPPIIPILRTKKEDITMSTQKVASVFKLPNGVVVRNRFGKGAMTECMADPATNLPNKRHFNLYKAWAEGGLGINITGNVQVDRRYMEAPRNVALEKDTDLEPFKQWAKESGVDGALLIMQISHAGRQCPVSVCTQPVCPSEVQLYMPGMPSFVAETLTRKPRALTAEDIDDVIERFVATAVNAEKAGFDGVQVHSAHGYLLSSFLSPHTNRRTDAYGGSIENRRRLLHTIIERIRAVVQPRFCVMIKLNSADFQRGGFTEEESLELLKSLEGKGVDTIEISGGTYEKMEAMQNVKKSTQEREAFFLEFAKKARKVTTIPLMLTGGFSTLKTMESALEGDVDFIGIARPVCTDANGPNRLMKGEIDALERFSPVTGIQQIDGPFAAGLNSFFHQKHIHNLATGAPVPSNEVKVNLWKVLLLDMTFTYYWDPWKNVKVTYPLIAGLVGLALFAIKAALF